MAWSVCAVPSSPGLHRALLESPVWELVCPGGGRVLRVVSCVWKPLLTLLVNHGFGEVGICYFENHPLSNKSERNRGLFLRNIIDGNPFFISKPTFISGRCFTSNFSGAKQNIYKNKKNPFISFWGGQGRGGVASLLLTAVLALLLHCTILRVFICANHLIITKREAPGSICKPGRAVLSQVSLFLFKWFLQFLEVGQELCNEEEKTTEMRSTSLALVLNTVPCL